MPPEAAARGGAVPDPGRILIRQPANGMTFALLCSLSLLSFAAYRGIKGDKGDRGPKGDSIRGPPGPPGPPGPKGETPAYPPFVETPSPGAVSIGVAIEFPPNLALFIGQLAQNKCSSKKKTASNANASKACRAQSALAQ